MTQQLLRLTYTTDNVSEPVVFHLGVQFGLTTNIRRANVARSGGWLELEVDGDSEDIDRAVDWARGLGVDVAVEAIPAEAHD